MDAATRILIINDFLDPVAQMKVLQCGVLIPKVLEIEPDNVATIESFCAAVIQVLAYVKWSNEDFEFSFFPADLCLAGGVAITDGETQ